MDQELKQHLEAMESRLENRLDNRIGSLDSRIGALDARFAAMDAKFATKQDLERVETNLLTEFHKWASPADAREDPYGGDPRDRPGNGSTDGTGSEAGEA